MSDSDLKRIGLSSIDGNPDPERIQLHPSGLNVFTECGERWRRMYEDDERDAGNEFTVVGSALDASVMADLEERMATGKLLPAATAIDIARVSVANAVLRGIISGEHTRNICLARATALADYAHRKVTPSIRPISVQEDWSVRLDKMLYARGGLRGRWNKIDLVGTLDIKEESYPDNFTSIMEPDGVNIRDIKTARASPPSDAADGKHWIQLTAYSLGEWVKTGKMPKRVQIDTLVTLKRGVEHRISVGERTDYDIAALFNRIVRFAQARKAGMYLPAPRGHWRCTEKWCQFYSSCSFVSNKQTIDLAVPPLRAYKSIHVSQIAPAGPIAQRVRRKQDGREDAF